MPVLGAKKRKKASQEAYEATRGTRGGHNASVTAVLDAKVRVRDLESDNQRMRKRIRDLRRSVKFAEAELIDNDKAWKKEKAALRDKVYKSKWYSKMLVESMEAGDIAYEDDSAHEVDTDDDEEADDSEMNDDDSAFENSEDDEKPKPERVRKKTVRKKTGHYKKAPGKSKAAADKFSDRKLAVLISSLEEQFGKAALEAWLLDSQDEAEADASAAVALSKVIGRFLKKFPRLWSDLVRQNGTVQMTEEAVADTIRAHWEKQALRTFSRARLTRNGYQTLINLDSHYWCDEQKKFIRVRFPGGTPMPLHVSYGEIIAARDKIAQDLGLSFDHEKAMFNVRAALVKRLEVLDNLGLLKAWWGQEDTLLVQLLADAAGIFTSKQTKGTCIVFKPMFDDTEDGIEGVNSIANQVLLGLYDNDLEKENIIANA